MSTEALRSRYRPPRVRVLLIGESPPAGGTFFYACNSNLFRHTKKAFEAALEMQWPSDHAFLAAFAGMGCYLDDLCLEPVNHDEPRERKAACRRGVGPLARRIGEFAPDRVIATPMSIVAHVRAAMQAARCSAPLHSLPFPVMHHPPAYVQSLAEIVRLHYRTAPT